MLDRLDRYTLHLLKRTLTRGGSPERLGRGLGAGFIGAFFPLSVFRVPAALLAALFFRGNRAISLLPPLLLSIFEPLIVSRGALAVASLLWRPGEEDLKVMASQACEANLSWLWLHPLNSIELQWAVLTGHGYLPFVLVLGASGMLLGGFLGVSSYPFTVVFLSYFYDVKIRAKQFMRLNEPVHNPRPFVLPPGSVGHAPSGVKIPAGLIERYCGKRAKFIPATQVRLLENGGQAYPEMLAAIAGAKRSIEMETYIIRPDKFGLLFGEALQEAGRRGVRVRFVVDGFGSRTLDEHFINGCAEAGVELRTFHALSSFWRRGYGFLQRRDHRKIIIVDGCVTLTGGLNIGNEYAPFSDGGGGWQDMHVRIEGEAVAARFLGVFEEAWGKGEPLKFPLPAQKNAVPPAVRPERLGWELAQYIERRHHVSRIARFSAAGVLTRIISNREVLERFRIKRAYLRAINASRNFILIENAFFIPDRDVLRALYRAVRRGVSVGVVLAMKCDVQIAAMASRALYDEMLARGIRIFEYRLAMVHSKVAVIDSHWATVSSYNLNQRSLIHDLEAGAIFFDELFAASLRDRLIGTISQCNEVTLELHRARPWSTALLESFCYLFRSWL